MFSCTKDFSGCTRDPLFFGTIVYLVCCLCVVCVSIEYNFPSYSSNRWKNIVFSISLSFDT